MRPSLWIVIAALFFIGSSAAQSAKEEIKLPGIYVMFPDSGNYRPQQIRKLIVREPKPNSFTVSMSVIAAEKSIDYPEVAAIIYGFPRSDSTDRRVLVARWQQNPGEVFILVRSMSPGVLNVEKYDGKVGEVGSVGGNILSREDLLTRKR